MPHLSFEYSEGVAQAVDLHGFARALRDAMDATGVFPLAGIRVRGHRCDIAEIGDGGAYDFLHMEVRLGTGRDTATKARVAEAIYAAAEQHLSPKVTTPFMLSLNMAELDPNLSIKRLNTVRTHMEQG